MTDSQEQPSGGDEIRHLLQNELLDRVQLLMKMTSSAGLRLQVPDTDIQIIAGPSNWIVSEAADLAGIPETFEIDELRQLRVRTHPAPEGGEETLQFFTFTATRDEVIEAGIKALQDHTHPDFVDWRTLQSSRAQRDMPGIMELRDKYKDGDYVKVEDVRTMIAQARSAAPAGQADEQVQQVLPPWPEPISPVAHERETIAPWLSDKQIVDALHSLGIDTEMSKYGFPEIQVRGTNVPNIRRLVAKLAAPVSPAGQQAPIPAAYLWYEPASEWNGYQGRERVTIEKPKASAARMGYTPLFAAPVAGQQAAPVGVEDDEILRRAGTATDVNKMTHFDASMSEDEIIRKFCNSPAPAQQAGAAADIPRWQDRAHEMDGPHKRLELACQEIEGLRALPAQAQAERFDQGPWRYQCEDSKHFVESADFTHDVRLYINGDFAHSDDREAYGEALAKALNAAPHDLAARKLPTNDEVYAEVQRQRDHKQMYVSTNAVNDVMAAVRALAAAPSPKAPQSPQTAPQSETVAQVGEQSAAVLRALVQVADWWRDNQDSPKSALSHFERVAEDARQIVGQPSAKGGDVDAGADHE